MRRARKKVRECNRSASRGLMTGIALFLVLRDDPVAAAKTPSAKLVYTRGVGAVDCPDGDRLKRLTAARLGYDPFEPDAEARTMQVTVHQRGSELVAVLDVRDVDGRLGGSRELISSDRDCQELLSSMALALAISIDPLFLSRLSSPPVRQSQSTIDSSASVQMRPTDFPRVPSQVVDAHARQVTSKDRIRLRFSTGVITTFGSTPSPSAGLTVQAGARWRTISLGVEGRGELATSSDSVPSGSVRGQLLLASAVPCVHFGVFLACGLAGIGTFHGRGVATPSRSETTVYAALGARMGFEVSLVGPLGLRVHGDVLASLTPTSLTLVDREVWSTPPVSGAGGLAVVATFP